MMAISPQELAAYADGELDAARAVQVEAAIATDPALASQVAAHRALKNRLAAHYGPIVDQPVPDRLAAMLASREAEVVDFASAGERQRARRRLPAWGWAAGSALAASLALALVLPGGGDGAMPYADAQLASVLDSRLVAEQASDADTRILLSFQKDDGQYCRAFADPAGGGIACRDAKGWHLEETGAGSEAASTDYRMAGAGDGEILARAQDMAAGPALDADAEAAAQRRGWR